MVCIFHIEQVPNFGLIAPTLRLGTYHDKRQIFLRIF